MRLQADTDCDTQPDSLQTTQDSAADGSFESAGLQADPPGGPPVCYVTEVDVAGMGTCNEATTPTSFAVSLEADSASSDEAVFGFREPGGLLLGNRVWYDSDRDGIQDAGEPGLAGAELRLRAGSCTAPTQAQSTSNAAGLYGFSDQSSGDYCVTLQRIGGDSTRWNLSPQDQGADDAADSDFHPGEAWTGVLTISEDRDDVDLGL